MSRLPHAVLCLSLFTGTASAQVPAACALAPTPLPAGLAALANGTMAGCVPALEAATAAYRTLPLGPAGPACVDGEHARQRLQAWLAQPIGELPSLPASFVRANGDHLGRFLASLTLGPVGRRAFVDLGWPVMITRDGKQVALVIAGVYDPDLNRATESVPLAEHLVRVARTEWLPGLSQMAADDPPPGITHLGYMATWLAGNSLQPDGPPAMETGALILPLSDVQRYARGDVTDAGLLESTQAYVCDRDHARVRKTEVRLAD